MQKLRLLSDPENTIVLIIFLGGLSFRLFTAIYAPLHLDELYNTIAARMVWEKGAPFFPSGILWPAGGLMLYLQAPFVRIFGELSPWVRIPGVCLSSLSILLLYQLGKRLFNSNVGLLAATAWAFDPDAVYWGANARQYSLHPLLVLSTLYLLYKAAKNLSDLKLGLRASISLFVAMWVQPPTLLWLPAFFLSYLIWMKKVIWRPVVITSAIVGMFALLVFALVYFGDPGLFQSQNDTSLTVSKDLSYGLGRYHSFLIGSPIRRILLFTAVLSILFQGFVKLRSRSFIAITAFFCISMLALSRFHYIQVGYSLALLCPLFLAGSYPALWLNKRVFYSVLCLFMILNITTNLSKLAFNMTEGPFDNLIKGYEFVHRAWLPGDAFLNSKPPAYVFSGENGSYYYLCATDCGLGLMKKGDFWVDRFLGAPQIRTPDELNGVLNQHKRVWYVLDIKDAKKRSTRVPNDLMEILEKRMTIVYENSGSKVFLKDATSGSEITPDNLFLKGPLNP